MSDTPRTDAAAQLVRATENGVLVHANFARELERENAALREAKDAYFRHNNILVELMTEEQKKKALDILIKPKEAQP